MEGTQFCELFGFTPSDEFHLFWEFAKSLNPTDPRYAFHNTTMITLVGPFDLLADRFTKEKAHYSPCLHWRYFGDTPEFVTLLTGGTDGLHWGYVVDRPSNAPLGIAGYYAYDDVTLFQESSGLFGLVSSILEGAIEDMDDDEEQATACKNLLAAIDSFCSQHKIVRSENTDLAYIEDCDPPPPFEFPEAEDFDKLPALICDGLKQLTADGFSEVEAKLKIGRLLWHWHENGNPLVEEAAYSLLDSAYESQQHDFLRQVLREHRQHRHRRSLDVFDA